MACGLEDEMLLLLVNTFPKAFFPLGRNCRPLRVGLFDELDAGLPPEIDRIRLRLFLSIYTRQPRYLQALVPGAARIDLNGNPAGRVSANEAASAKRRLQKPAAVELAPHIAKTMGGCLASSRAIPPVPQPANRAGLAEVRAGNKGPQRKQPKLIVVLKKRRPPRQVCTKDPSVQGPQGRHALA
jgi:sRNA-binding protein